MILQQNDFSIGGILAANGKQVARSLKFWYEKT